MATTSDLAPTRRKAASAASQASAEVREEQLELQIAQLQADLKGIAATLAKLSQDKVNEVRDVARSEARHIQRQGQNVLEDVQDQAGELEQQLKDKIREKPLTAVASAIGIGFVLALLSRALSIMNLLVPLAALLGFELETLKERAKRTLLGNVIMSMLALTGVCFMLIAGFFALSALTGPIYAALIFAVVFLVSAFAVYLSMRAGAATARRAAAEKRRSGETGAFVTTAALTALPVLLRSPMIRNLGLPAAAIAALLLLRGNKSD